jgi:hypothetical protein
MYEEMSESILPNDDITSRFFLSVLFNEIMIDHLSNAFFFLSLNERTPLKIITFEILINR